ERPEEEDGADRDEDEPAGALRGQARLENLGDADPDQDERPVPEDVPGVEDAQAVERVDHAETDQDRAGDHPAVAAPNGRAVHDPPPGPVWEGGVSWPRPPRRPTKESAIIPNPMAIRSTGQNWRI